MNKLTTGRISVALLSLLVAWGGVACQSKEELKKEQYYVEGYRLYQLHCSNCHQEDGAGMANLYPSVATSKMLLSDAQLACLIRYGTNGSGELQRPMPPNPQLTELEIAEVITYLNVNWAQDTVYTQTELIGTALKACQP
ncbi:mono/diheme cytochrome c family protein [Dyadobacter jejuensis]|uniref:Mono/diheme cytochrome c family protein n=1 Tax=Dyadobacter jejuensis TaxID=1082580 RepID=A0A316AJS2_9BACT|nr:cytochrome c [Dyadobacter jejuensis]PWJ57110.1 mono/diheme cytochrome c family protein [Dyadobacter jejuensis]